MKQLRGFVVGSESLDAAPRLQVQELVLVENLKVCIAWIVYFGSWVGKGTNCW